MADSERKPAEQWVFAAVLLCFYGVYLLLRIDPKLLYQAQEPAFLLDPHFAAEFLRNPGGVNELIGRFLSQFFYFSWTGTILLVLVFWLVAWETGHLMRALGVHQPMPYFHWIPSIFLLVLHSYYRFPLVLTLGLAWALAGTVLYVRLAPASRGLRFLCFALTATLVYYVTAGQAVLFVVLAVMVEVLWRRQIAAPLLYAAFAGLLPYAGASTVFIMHAPDAYTLHLASYDTYTAGWLLWATYAVLPTMLLAVALEQRASQVQARRKGTARLWDRLVFRRSAAMQRIQGILVLGLAVTGALCSFEQDGNSFLSMDYYAQHRQWDRVIECAKAGMYNSQYGLFQANRALYHTGRLGDELFSLPQVAGAKGLFLPRNLCELLPLRESDVFFDLGLVNEAQHWAHEAVSVTGESPWNLQRLVLVNLLKNDRVVADKYLGLLDKTLWHRAWAKLLRSQLLDPSDPPLWFLAEEKGNMPASDFLVSPAEPERCLEEMLKNTRNKMAFEYFMAYCLLEGDLSRFAANLHRLTDLGYSRIPRHFQEAMLIYMQLTGRKDVPLPGQGISPETLARFNAFNAILTRHGRNKDAALGELVQYKDTYWFYGLYYYKPKES
jgi:hypothetical protein